MRDSSKTPAGKFFSENGWISLAAAAGFSWRLWLSQATFLNTDEAWHFSVANQESIGAALHASHTLAHPPLLVLVLYFWKAVGTSELVLRLPGVIAGTLFCCVFFLWLKLLFGRATAWCGFLLVTFLPPMIALTVELRQYSWMLLFATTAAYLLERALLENSQRWMLFSFSALYLAMLSHYSAFLFAAGLGIYAIHRMVLDRPAFRVAAFWVAGQVVGVTLAFVLYKTHIAKLGSVYPAGQPLHRFGDFYLSDWYFHPGRDHLAHFLFRGTLGVFRFIFGQTAIGQFAAFAFLFALVLQCLKRATPGQKSPPQTMVTLFALPFLLNWIAVLSGLYPYGRTRQCIFLAVFALAGVSVAISCLVRDRVVASVAVALCLALVCNLWGTLQGRDMLPLADQRRAHMEQAIEFIRTEISPSDVLLTDMATSFQLRHYLCNQKPVKTSASMNGLETFNCGGLQVFFTGAHDGALTPQFVYSRQQEFVNPALAGSSQRLWVMQAGWASGLGEALRGAHPDFATVRIESFGRFIEIFELPAYAASR